MSDNNSTIDNAAPATFAGRKLYYTISEVSRLTGLKDSVLRGWDREFPQLRPKRSSAGVRSYKARDIELILYIKRLLHEEKYTVTGARQRIAEERRSERLGGAGSGLGTGREESHQRGSQREERPTPLSENLPVQIQSTQPPDAPSAPSSELIASIRGELAEILSILES